MTHFESFYMLIVDVFIVLTVNDASSHQKCLSTFNLICFKSENFKMFLFRVCFILYFLKLRNGYGLWLSIFKKVKTD